MLTSPATAALASLMLSAAPAPPVVQKTVTIKGSLHPEKARTDHFTVRVEFDIAQGWHTYDDIGEGSEVPTSLQWTLPDGATAIGGWSRPSGIEGTQEHSRIYTDRVDFARSVRIEPSAYGETIEVEVAYQACTDDFCNPPQSKTLSITIPVTGGSSGGIFEAPVRLMANGSPLNTEAKRRFPSPAIFDVDGDGQKELFIGELMGRVGFYENLNTSGSGDPVWGKHQDLKGPEGKLIRTSNW